MHFKSKIQKYQRPERRKSHGISHNLGLNDLAGDLGQHVEQGQPCSQRVIR